MTTMENGMKGPQKIKNRTIIQSSNFILGIYLKKMKTLIQKNMCNHSSVQHYLQ